MMAAMTPQHIMAQDSNEEMSDNDIDIKSLYEMVSKHEKKSEAVNLYFNYGACCQMTRDSREGEWTSRFYNRDLRLEMRGWLTDNIFYRFRHRLNKASSAQSEDNFAKATDYMMVGWRFNDRWTIQGGKKNQSLGSFEYDENTLFVYQFSDIEDKVDGSKGGINVLYSPTPNHEFSVEVCNTYNGKLADEFGENAMVIDAKTVSNATTGAAEDASCLQDNAPVRMEKLEKANAPFSYNLRWNGKFFDGKLNTRWSYTLRTQAKHKYSRFLRLGQQLRLNNLRWYLDYNMTYDDLDRMKIASNEVTERLAPMTENLYVGKVRYQGVVSKLNWQIAPCWNLVAKGMYETADVTKSEQFRNYRKALGCVGCIEYYPAREQKQDLRLFLAYTGRKYDYSKKSGLTNYNTNRVEIGMLYRIKAF